jgi:tripartite-type tricarboxylate transporter receptor subunit TctC
MSTRRVFAAMLFPLLFAGSPAAVYSQDYPIRPVRIVTASPGGGNDYLARIVAQPLGAALGQQFIVDNRVSRFVGGIVARATPDGYTLVVGGSTFQFVPLMEKADYDPIASFAPISQLERSPNVLVVHPSLGVNSVKELVALARAKPGALRFGTGGTGGSLHTSAEMFKLATSVNLSRVPYKSTGPALLGLLTGEVQIVFSTPGGAMSHVASGKLKALPVTSIQRSSLIPGVPTLDASGLPGYDLDTIGFIMAPLKTPDRLIRLLNQNVRKLMSDPDVAQRLAGGGSEVATGTPEQLIAKLRTDDAKMRKLFKQIGLSSDS